MDKLTVDIINELLDSFVDDEVGLELGTFNADSNFNRIWYGYKKYIKQDGSKEEWVYGAERLIQMLHDHEIGDYELTYSSVRGAEVRRIT